jgi:hypothetical protein
MLWKLLRQMSSFAYGQTEKTELGKGGGERFLAALHCGRAKTQANYKHVNQFLTPLLHCA